jgi:hypothetical protein
MQNGVVATGRSFAVPYDERAWCGGYGGLRSAYCGCSYRQRSWLAEAARPHTRAGLPPTEREQWRARPAAFTLPETHQPSWLSN